MNIVGQKILVTNILALLKFEIHITTHLFQGTIKPNMSPPTVNQTQSIAPSQYPTIARAGRPTISPFIYRTQRPTTASPIAFLPQDKATKFGGKEFKRLESIILSASPNSVAALSDKDTPQFRAFEWVYSNAPKTDILGSRLVQRWVLASFYFGLNGDGWIKKDGWLKSEDECLWYGVSCLDGSISKLELRQNRLVGKIVPEISLWGSDLYTLSLGNDYDATDNERNQIIMPLPSFLGDFPYLSFLNLEGVGLTSTIPMNLFSSWSHLEYLYLNDNDLTGTIPSEIAHLSSIEVLWLGGNNLGGPFVSEIGQLSTLVDLSLDSNFREDRGGKRGIIMTLPTEIGLLTNLEILVLADNALSGVIPIQLGDLISLRHLHLSSNFFENQLPISLGKLELLEEFDVSFNWCV